MSVRSTLVRNHSFYFGRVGFAYENRPAQMALALLVLGRQDVAQVRFRPFYFSGPSLFEALGSAFVCLKFRHNNFPSNQISLRSLLAAARSDAIKYHKIAAPKRSIGTLTTRIGQPCMIPQVPERQMKIVTTNPGAAKRTPATRAKCRMIFTAYRFTLA